MRVREHVSPAQSQRTRRQPEAPMETILPQAPRATTRLEDQLSTFRGRIFRYIRHLVRDRAEAEDLTQETLLRACARQDSLRDPAALPAWLYRIATTVCTDRLRQLARIKTRMPPRGPNDPEPADLPDPDPDTPALDEALERGEMSACVQEFVAKLSDSYRAVILLHDVEGLTGAEVAAVLGSSLDSVKVRLHRARRTLRTALQAGCDLSNDRRGVLTCGRKGVPTGCR
jgi:RNA polymerase sigma-70 factor (ECF subfamily)